MIAHVNIMFPDHRYPKLKIYISELILDGYKYIPVAYVKIAWHDLTFIKVFLAS